MTPEENKAIVRRMVEEAQSQGRVEAIDELFAEDFVDLTPTPGFGNDKQAVRELFGYFHQVFSGCCAEIHEQIAEGDKVMTRKTIRGKHVADFAGIPPTGTLVEMRVIDILTLRSGKIIEHRNLVDQFGFMQQLGVIPRSETSPAG